MAEPVKNPVGIKTSIGASTGIGAVLVAMCNQLLPSEWKEMGLSCVPLISPALSFIGIYLFNRLVEPPEIVSFKARLRRDKIALKKLIKDKLIDEESREKAKKEYAKTSLLLATVGRTGIPSINDNAGREPANSVVNTVN